MSITTYNELQTAVGNWLNRGDLTSRIPEFIALAEARMNRDQRLRTRDSIVRETLAVSSQFKTLPTGFLRMVNCELQTDPVRPLTYATPQQMDVIRNQQQAQAPNHYSIIGTEIELAPVPDASYTLGLIYYSKITALTLPSSTNWLLTAAPDIYLYASLMQSAPYLMNDERLATWGSLYDTLCNEYQESSRGDEVSGSPMAIRSQTIG